MDALPLTQAALSANTLRLWTHLSTLSSTSISSSSSIHWPPTLQDWSPVEAYNTLSTAAALLVVLLTTFLLRSRPLALAHDAAPLPAAPTTTFDLAKASLQEQRAAVDATYAQYRGTPINEAGFKRAVRWRIRALSLCALLAVVLDAGSLALPGKLVARQGFAPALIADIVLWVIILAITLRPLHTHEGWARVGQLSVLATISASTHVVRLLIPLDAHTSAPLDVLRKAGKHHPPISADQLQIAALLLSLIAFAITLTLPSGPLRSFAVKPGEDEELPMMADQDSGASILTMLYVGWCTPMMLTGRRKGYVTEDDVPVLSVSMRAAVLHARMTLRTRTQRALSHGASATQRALRLLTTLFRTNDRLLLIVLFTEVVGSALFYLPPYLLWKIVGTMEESEAHNEPRSLSFRRNLVYIVAFFVGQLVQVYTISIAQMTAMATLKNRIKAQLNTLLLSKALRRKDFSTPAEAKHAKAAQQAAATDGEREGENKEDDKGDHFDLGSKSKVIALHTIDVQRVLELVQSSFFLINGPVEIIFGTILLYGLLGLGGFIGLATAVVPVPFVFFLSKWQSKLQVQMMQARDERTAALNEGMQAIRMVKLAAWESRMVERVQAARRKEISLMRIGFYLETATRLIGELSPILIVVTAFVWSTLVEGRKLTPGIAFASFAVLKELRWSIEGLPQVITECLQSFVSLRRVAIYLDSPEVEPAPRLDVDAARAAAATWLPVVVALHEATVGWPVFAGFGAEVPAPPSPFCLRDVSVDFATNELNLICGRLGSGKTLLLLSLLGEAELLSGRISCPRSPADAIVQSDNPHLLRSTPWLSRALVAYAPQQAVILNGSIRFNILWGLPFERARYDEVVRACGLLPDLAAFEDGDATEIGEGGIGLSGGQKARVGLARAVYSRAQTLLLDDILSAVDAHTAAHIHKELLQGPLVQDRTVLLVSHQVQLVAPSAGLVLVLDDGKVQFTGSAAKFLASEHYSGLAEADSSVDTLVEAEAETTTAAKPAADKDADAKADEEKDAAGASGAAAATNGDAKDAKAPGTTPTKDPEMARKLVEDEKRERGTIAYKVWAAYFRAAGGPRVVIPTAVLVVLSEMWTIVPAGWLAAMTADTSRVNVGLPMVHSLQWWLGGYSLLSVAGALVSGVRYAVFFAISWIACQRVFDAALSALFRAPIRFHDTTPRGRIMNRFGSDVQIVDEQLIWTIPFVTRRLLAFLLSCAVVSIEGSPLFLALIVLLAPAYQWVANCFRIVVRDVRRIGQTTKSPVAQTFSDVLAGLAVIRAFGSVETTMQTFYQRLDHNIRFDNLQMHRWSSTTMSTFTAVQLFAAACFIASNDGTTAATAALALSFLLDLGGHLQAIVAAMAQLEFCMVGVERLTEFAEIKPEAAEIVEPRPPASWPESGEVEFKELRVRYAPELPEVLKGVSFKAPGGSKIGIVGPTGCGKSTTVTSLFRFVEFAGGSIEIDGVDISKIGLKDLRSRIQIVPQDPVILSGTLRDAIDMFHERTDAEILEALQKVHLITSTPVGSPRLNPNGTPAADANGNGNASAAEDSNKNVFEDLDYRISEGGSNLSNGQRQLLCMARALLGRSKVVVFDEASSSVDTDTDTLITATLQKAFSHCTVITIAHRLRTIMHSDHVVVMDKGVVAEFASPKELLQRPESHFFKLCAASGRAEFEKLRELAGLPSSSGTSTPRTAAA